MGVLPCWLLAAGRGAGGGLTAADWARAFTAPAGAGCLQPIHGERLMAMFAIIGSAFTVGAEYPAAFVTPASHPPFVAAGRWELGMLPESRPRVGSGALWKYICNMNGRERTMLCA